MIQDFINKQFYNLFVFTFIFGLVLYGTIGFESIDEICAFVLLAMLIFSIFNTPDWSVNKSFLIVIGIFCFYTFYSFYIHSNSAKGIFMDVIIQFKPYLAFFAVYYLHPVFTKSQKKLLKDILYVVWGVMFCIGVASLSNIKILNYTVGHVAYFAAIMTGASLVYFYCSEGSKKDKFIFLAMLATGLFSARSKIYGFFVLAVMTVLFSDYISKLKLNIKTIALALISLGAMVLVSWRKLVMYFGVGKSMESIPEGYMARAMLYNTSLDIFKDYFPFGSGFGSFASYPSGVYYSSIYSKYNIQNIKGISKLNYSYIADTYYPCLAQFGVVGALLYLIFFIFIFQKAYKLYMKSKMEKHFIIPFLIIGYLFIENIADATFTGHRGFFIMMLLGLILSESSQKINTIQQS